MACVNGKYPSATLIAPYSLCSLLFSMWLGIELEQPVGKNDGSVADIKYFDCKPSHGVFAPPAKVTK